MLIRVITILSVAGILVDCRERVISIPELAIMFSNCSGSSKPSLLKFKHRYSKNIAQINNIPENKDDSGECKCGKCGFEHPQCRFFLDSLCKKDKSNEVHDPNYATNHCENCPEFRHICGKTCNYCGR